MSSLQVENVHIGRLRVSHHARERWSERSSGDLAESLGRAVPFGGQRGNSILLLDGDVVFTVDRSASIVTTVLTKAQAMVNMEQSNGCRPVTSSDVGEYVLHPQRSEYKGGLVAAADPAVVVADKQAKDIRREKKKENEAASKFVRLFRLTDEELAEELRYVQGGIMRNVYEREQGVRRQLAKARQHSQLMEKRYNQMKEKVLQMLTPAQVEELWGSID